MHSNEERVSISTLEKQNEIMLGRGNVISKEEMRANQGPFPVYSSSAKNNGKMGCYSKWMFDEELITWSIDGGGSFFFRPKHKFSVTNVSGYMRVLSKNIDAKYLFYALENEHSKLKFDYLMKAHPSVVRDTYNIYLPPINEQKKISKIIGSIDESIQSAQERLRKYKFIFKGLLEELLLSGINHKKFQHSPYGEIPASWSLLPLSKVLEKVERPVKLLDDETYRLVTVKRRNEGIVKREELKGKNILVKNYYMLKQGDFVISKRQIVHGACEILPKQLDGSVVSNEYDVFIGSPLMSIIYFNYLSKLPFMYELFFSCSHGVDIEKLLFKTSWWLKKCIPVPPMEEQRRIEIILRSFEDKIAIETEKLDKLIFLRRGLLAKIFNEKAILGKGIKDDQSNRR